MRRIILVPLGLLAFALLISVGLGYVGQQPWDNIPANAASDARLTPGAAFYASGDMGIDIGFGRPIVRAIADGGVPLITLNSLAYFRNWRTAGEVEAMVRQAVERSLAQYRTNKVVLIGQSFGAEALVVGFKGLSPALRKHVAGLILIVPGENYMLRSSPGEALSFWEAEYPIRPYISGLARVPVVCLRGADERVSLCPSLVGDNIEQITLPGGHLLDFAGATVAQIVTDKTKALLAAADAEK